MKLRRVLAIIVCMIILVAAVLPAYATNDNNNSRGSFRDVPEKHWAFDAIKWMIEKKIVEGVGDDQFLPNKEVARDEYAKMLVLTLKLPLINPDVATFKDVKRGSWQYKYVESARNYITFYSNSNGEYSYHPAESAKREDMAVALVKALGYANETVDENLLGIFSDIGQISPKLKKYVAIAVKHNLIEGSVENGVRYFKPQGTLTRAAASTLLYRAFKENEEKITFEEEKTTLENEGYTVPLVSVTPSSENITVSWRKITSSKLQGYKVVVSRNDSSPAYPDSGYFEYITDVNRTSSVLKPNDAYNGGDFGGRLQAGENYYFSVTAIYSDKTVVGNTVRARMPSQENLYPAPRVSGEANNARVLIKWGKIESDRLQGYMVIASKSDSTPTYPENGYFAYITDRNRTYAELKVNDVYNGGDFGGKLQAGVTYYFRVIAIYSDRKVDGNTIRAKMPNEINLYPAPKVSGAASNGRILLKWGKIESDKLQGYKVVVSKSDSTPASPENGYFEYITDKSRTTSVLKANDVYNGGDFGGTLQGGETYYFSVTAVYNDKNVAGNTVSLKVPITVNLYPAPKVSLEVSGDKVLVKWNKITSTKLQGYRVVVSKSDATPAYPENGYIKWITDKNDTSEVLRAGNIYHNGDFGGKLVAGETYYYSVTAVYNDRYVAGNAVQAKMPAAAEAFKAPSVTASVYGDAVVVKWDKIVNSKLQGYMVVISKSDSTPGYPANGFFTWITDLDKVSENLRAGNAYNGGDFGGTLKAGETYYCSVTAVYTDRYMAGNAVQMKIP